MTEPKWVGRVDMAQYAEALGITTDSIMSVAPDPNPERGAFLVLFTDTPTSEPDAWIHMALLVPDDRRVLHVARREPWKTIGQFNEGLREHMERTLGPPEGENNGAV